LRLQWTIVVGMVAVGQGYAEYGLVADSGFDDMGGGHWEWGDRKLWSLGRYQGGRGLGGCGCWQDRYGQGLFKIAGWVGL